MSLTAASSVGVAERTVVPLTAMRACHPGKHPPVRVSTISQPIDDPDHGRVQHERHAVYLTVLRGVLAQLEDAGDVRADVIWRTCYFPLYM